MGVVNVFIICAAMFELLMRPLLAQSLNPFSHTNARHSAGLPLYIQNPGVFSQQTRLYPNMQQPQNVDKTFVFPHNTYHTLDNVNLLPPDVELIPPNLVAGGNKGPLIFPTGTAGGSEPAPYVVLITNGFSPMPYPLHHYHHHHQHHPHSHPHLGDHRPMRPVHPSYYPHPQPPVATIPPDVEVFPHHQKPSYGNRPVRPMPTPRPWYPPAMPSYHRWIYEMNKSKQRVADCEINKSFARSVSDSSNDTDSQLRPKARAVFNQTAQPLNPYEEEAYQILPYGISNNHPDEKLDESSVPIYVLVPLQPNEGEVVNPHPEDESKEFHRPLSQSTATDTFSKEDELDSTDQPTASSEHSKVDLNSFDEGGAEADRITLEEVSQTDGADEAQEPANVDMAMFDIQKMDANFPKDRESAAVEGTDGVTERVVEPPQKLNESQNSDVDGENLGSILDEMIKIEQKLDADSIYVEKVTEMDHENDNMY